MLDDDDIAAVLFTSGTTSEPKGVVLRHGNLTAYVLQTVELLGAEEDDCALVAVPQAQVARRNGRSNVGGRSHDC